MIYTTCRGRQTPFRPYGQINRAERKQIIRDWLSMGSRETLKKWNITHSTLGHIKWHNRDLIEQVEDENFERAGL